MAVTLEQLLNLTQLKPVTVAAGRDGISRKVAWINTIESPELVEFIHPSELVFSTGVEIKGDRTALMTLIRGACEAGAAGSVINLGPYITELPEEAVLFAEQKGYPLITVPWDVRLADLTRIICDCIISRSEKNDETKDLLYRLLTARGDPGKLVERLSGQGWPANLSCTVVALETGGEDDSALLREIGGKFVYSYYRYWPFVIGGRHIFAVTWQNTQQNGMDGLADAMESLEPSLTRYQARMGIGGVCDGPALLPRSLLEAETAVRVSACRTGGARCLRFDRLGIYKVLLELNGNPILLDFGRSLLQPLIDYDKINATQYLDFLRVYLQNDANIAKTSGRLYIHRNTAMYKLDKIEKILGCDLSSLQPKAELLIALIVHDFL